MATLNITAPDGKKLSIQVPEGTDPSKYEEMVDEVVQHYNQQSAAKNMDFERGPEYPSAMYTEANPTADLAATYGAAKGAVSLAKATPGIASAIGEGLSNLPEAAGNAVDTVKSWLPNPSIKGLGYGAAQVGTEAGQDLAKASQEYAATAQPELGQLVAKAGGQVPEDTQSLVTRAAADEMKEPISGLNGSEANSPSNTGIFNTPIARGMANSTGEMRDLTGEQWKQVGNAIDNTLQGLERTGEQFDPEPVLKQIDSMYIRDAQGKLMTTGVQGETNQAIGEALESMKDYANGDKIGWQAANHIKSQLQDSANYGSKKFEAANDAYKQVASLIKDGIDNQAATVLADHGGNVEDFQHLRDAYSKLSSLRTVLNPAAGKELLQPSFPEQVLGAAKKYAPWGIATGLGAAAANKIF